MKNNALKEQIETLERLYEHFNKCLFEGNLPGVALTIQSNGRRGRTMGWCTAGEVWHNSEETKFYEINLAAEFLDLGLMEISSILIHEMVHLYCSVNGIDDCNTKTGNHKVAFKQNAEKIGLIVERDGRSGWANTSLSDALRDMVTGLGYVDVFNISRRAIETVKREPKPSYAYSCLCGVKFKSKKKDLNLVCGDCNQPLLAEEK